MRVSCRWQESWGESEISAFVKSRFRVGFDMFSKINVNGVDAHPLFKYLKMKMKGTFGEYVLLVYGLLRRLDMD